MAKRGKGFLSLATILSSFFGAAMIAGAFAYFNYKFSQYKFIDFKQMIFYEKKDIFSPTSDKYIIIFYSSKDKQTADELSQVKLKIPILAIDYYNNIKQNTKHVTFLRSGTTTSLKFIHKFHIYQSPSIFFIKKIKDSLYKQDSMIRKLDDLKKLSQNVNSL